MGLHELPNKKELFAELIVLLTAEREALVAAQRTSAEGVTHADARSDGSKDMRATEASYIARGQALRVQALHADLERVSAMSVKQLSPEAPIALSALVELDGEKIVLLAPAGGGTALADGRVRVVTPSAPIGRALIGGRLGDFIELERGAEVSEHEITAVG